MTRTENRCSFSNHAFLASLSVLLSFLIYAPAASADNETTRASDNAIWIAAGADLFAYKEELPPPVIDDSERDGLPSVAGGISWLGTEYDLYMALEGSVSWGNARYNGAYLAAPTVPISTTTKETIYNTDFKLGQAFELEQHVLLIPYGQVGYRYWERNIGGTGNEEEDYQNYDIMGGLMLQLSPFSDLVLTGYGAAGSTLSPKMKIYGVTFDLGDQPVYNVGGKIGYNIDDNIELFSTVDYERLSYKQSNVEYGAYEPSSNTNETNVRVGLAYHY